MSTNPLGNDSITLANWRESPHSRWSFQHVENLVRCDVVDAGGPVQPLQHRPVNLDRLSMEAANGRCLALPDWLDSSHTDGFAVLHRGELVYQWCAGHFEINHPHLVFSVSKSITALLAGALKAAGRLDFQALVTRYIPEAEDSGYGSCSVQQLLDMTASIDFDESYTVNSGQYARYRTATAWNPPIPGQQVTHLKAFLLTLQPGDRPHGEVFSYLSPTSDMLGWVCVAAAGMGYAEALSHHIWKPLGAAHPALVTIDGEGTARAAGGLCVHLHDLARLGEMMRHGGSVGDQQVVPAAWVEDTLHAGSFEAWKSGGFTELFPHGRYRNQWYQAHNDHRAFCAIGIHGQWIYVDPAAEMTVVKLSSQPDPVNDQLDDQALWLFDRLARELTR